jgi:glyoxylase-like metal-dependent hydrolase (beta-lactamase superfamily II)
VPELFVTSFRGVKQHTFHTYSYQIVFQDKTIMIDAVTDHKTAEAILPGSTEQPGQYDRMQLGLRQASSVVFTHEHFDHCSGIATSPYFDEISERIHFTAEQMPGLGLPKPEKSGFTQKVIERLSPLIYQDLYKLAPGVVLIKAPSHTPGSQMIYIQLKSGEEFLLVGDIAWHMDNITKPKHHPRFVSFLSGEDEMKNIHLLRWLFNLHHNNPKLHILVAHDGEQMNDYFSSGLIGADLELDSSR